MMSCIKFPSSKNDISKTSSKEKIEDLTVASTRLMLIADQVFGQGKWSHAITNQTLDFIDYVAGKYQAGCATIVKVQLKDGIFHEDMGYAYAEGSSKASAIQKVRIGSFNSGLKKTLMYFGNEVTCKINSLSSRPSSPIPVEPAANKFLQIEASTSSVPNKVVEEPFAESIPLSQADALMDIVDLDQVFSKYQKVNPVNNVQVKTDVPKLVVSTGKTDKEMKSNNENNIKNEVKVDVPKIIAPTAGVKNSNNVDKKSDIISEKKKDNKIEIPKAVVSTVMTEEEMRLERKRKQREMQEEFKRKEEYKKKAGDGASKHSHNPRY